MGNGPMAEARLRPEVVERLERLFCGSAAAERAILGYLKRQYGVGRLTELTEEQAQEVLAHSYEFAKAAREYYEPELF